MLCYRDMTFCADTAECGTEICSRKWTDEVHAQYKQACKQAEFEYPVAYSHFKEICSIYQPLKGQDNAPVPSR